MSRVANNPVALPSGVECKFNDNLISVKGPKGTLEMAVHPEIKVEQEDQTLTVNTPGARTPMAGTTRSLIQNMVTGVTDGFTRKMQLVGVGYRAQMQGKTLNMALGFSHPITYVSPEGITIETPSQTEILITGIDKQSVGQVAAEIRAFRPPEPYKGKGVRYDGERIVLKEAKKV